MSVNLEMPPRLPTRRAAARYAENLGYQRVGKHFMSGNRFAVIERMPASGTYKVIVGVPT
mgnify:CR=1 FL=1